MSRSNDGLHPFLRPSSEQGEERSSRGKLLIASCRSGEPLARETADCYDKRLKSAGCSHAAFCLHHVDFTFPDTETCVRLEETVNGCDVFLFQSLFDPTSGRTVDQNYMSFLLAVRAFRENGARHVTGVLPYLSYARQDKATPWKREPVSSRLMAELSVEAGMDRLITWHPHCDQVKGFYGRIPVHMLDPLLYFTETFERDEKNPGAIVVAADEGVSGLATSLSRELKVSGAIAPKVRLSPDQVHIPGGIIGDFTGKTRALIVDDMISGGGTMETLIRKLAEQTGNKKMEIQIAASHNLCLPAACERLQKIGKEFRLEAITVTNSIPQTDTFRELPFARIYSISDQLCRVINRIHFEGSVSEIFRT